MTRATPTSSLSLRQLQDRWSLSESTVDRVLRRHADLLPAFRVGRTVRVTVRARTPGDSWPLMGACLLDPAASSLRAVANCWPGYAARGRP